jgi:hypothetical protein
MDHRRDQRDRKVSEMINRREFFPLLAALASATQLRGAATPMRTAGVFPLPAPYQDQSATVVELKFAPGERSMAHRHPGFVIVMWWKVSFGFKWKDSRNGFCMPATPFMNRLKPCTWSQSLRVLIGLRGLLQS